MKNIITCMKCHAPDCVLNKIGAEALYSNVELLAASGSSRNFPHPKLIFPKPSYTCSHSTSIPIFPRGASHIFVYLFLSSSQFIYETKQKFSSLSSRCLLNAVRLHCHKSCNYSSIKSRLNELCH